MSLSDADVDAVLELLDGLGLDAFDLTTDTRTVSLRRHPDGGWAQRVTERRAPDLIAGPDAEVTRTEGVGGEGAEDASVPDGLVAVRAPLLGTFYRAPRPGAAPYVEVGDDVETDTVVGIIETMKLMNSVEAGVRGRVVEIRVANAAFADRDTVLMVVEPDGSST
jgi:acetyl-CoA carboxylase biotin carboxyl carrier protein